MTQITHLGLRLRINLGVPRDLVNQQHVPGVRKLRHHPIATIAVDPRQLEGLPIASLLMATIKEAVALGAELAHGLVRGQPHLAVEQLLALHASKLKIQLRHYNKIKYDQIHYTITTSQVRLTPPK